KQLKALVRQGYKQGYINISNRNLSEIPDYVFNPDDVFEVENINYDFNRNTDNDDWWDITELKKLNIANNNIEVISPKIGQMETLVHLNFCDNKLASLPDEIQNLKLVTSIHLERNNFTFIPSPLFELENLVELFLFNNKLSGDLNEYDFYRLSNLEVLDLSENLIENVGDCFSQNKKLRKLQLSHNKIKEITSLDLKHCKELELSHNELVSIFTEKQSFPKLQRLDLRNNKLQFIGEQVSCPELKELYLTSNRLSSLGSLLKSATNLNILDIYGNVFKEVPKDILNLKDITRLDLGNNDISELPPRLGLLKNIKFLRFEGNMIKGIKATKTSDILATLKNRIPINELNELQGFYLFFNMNSNINNKKIPPPSSSLSSSSMKKIEINVSEQDLNIRNLNLSSKELVNLDQYDFNSLQFNPESINLSKNLLITVPNSLILFSSSLTSLTLDFNKITSFPERFVLPNLLKLSMTHNLLKEFPENTDPSHFPKLLELNLSYNNIQKLPSTTIPFPALETLIISKNRIEAIENPEVFGQLSILDLSDNSIGFIPPKLGLCSKLKKLSLEGNTFRVPRYQVLQKGTAAILAYLKDRIP
ncbi:L domain-like protein, partial [Anaeromyces robustus]